jgi:hypothetical protein
LASVVGALVVRGFGSRGGGGLGPGPRERRVRRGRSGGEEAAAEPIGGGKTGENTLGGTTAVDVGGPGVWGRGRVRRARGRAEPRRWRSGRGVHGGGGRGRRGRGARGSSRRRGNLGSGSSVSRPRSGIEARTLTLRRATCPTASGAGIPQDREGRRGSGHDRRAGGGVRPPAHGGRDQPARRGGDRRARAGGPPHGLGRSVELLNEVSAGKSKGEEDRYARTDLYDTSANIEGSEVAFEGLKPEVAGEDVTLANDVVEGFGGVYGELERGRARRRIRGRYAAPPADGRVLRRPLGGRGDGEAGVSALPRPGPPHRGPLRGAGALAGLDGGHGAHDGGQTGSREDRERGHAPV